jgi:chromosomal replication initiation ATPase DnaA
MVLQMYIQISRSVIRCQRWPRVLHKDRGQCFAKVYGKAVSELLKRRRERERERENEARAMAIYLCRAVGGHKLEDIGKVMGLKNYSSVSSAYLAVKQRLELEKGLASSARKVERLLKSRKQP